MSGAVTVGVAAIAIGTAVATDFATFAVIAAVGATVSAVGAIAKVPALQYAGAAIGAVGAVGGLASAAGVFGEAGVFGSGGTVANAFGGASAAAPVGGFSESAAQIAGTNAAAVGGADNFAGLGASASWADNAWAGNGVIDQVTSGMPTAAAASSPEIASARSPTIGSADGGEPGTTNVNGQAGEQLAQAPAITNAPAPPVTPSGPLVDATAPVTGSIEPSWGGMTSGTTGPDFKGVGLPGKMDMSSSTWGDIFGFLKDNKTLVSGAVQAGASFLSGALSPLTPAQVNALDAQAKANQAAANKSNAETDILNMRASNMGQPIPVASRITGRPALGIVNQAAPITGVPA